MKNQFLDEFELFIGIKNKIPLCCIIFYESAWLPHIRKKIDEYSEKMWEISEHSGILLCPDCLVETLKKKRHLNGEKMRYKKKIDVIAS